MSNNNDTIKLLKLLNFLAEHSIKLSSKSITLLWNLMGGTSKSLATKLGWLAVQGYDVVNRVWVKK